MSVLSRMPGVLAKAAELAGAGLASAAGAYLFSQFAKPATPPPPAAIVQIEPNQQELVRAVRSENAALIQELRKAETAKEAATEATPPRAAAVASPKPPKISQASGASHKPNPDRVGTVTDRKSERVYEADSKAPAPPADERPQSTPSAPPVLGSDTNPAAQAVDSAAAIDQGPTQEPDMQWFARLRQIPELFRPAPSPPSLVPRPPLPVGEFAQGAM
jgi:hypothetical protein